MPDLALLFWSLLVFLLVYAAFCDLINFTIPNQIVLGVAFFGIARTALEGIDLSVLANSLIGCILLFLVGLFLFSKEVLGGGDVKLLAALGLWSGVSELPRLLLALALAGGIFSLFIVIYNLANSLLRNGKFPPVKEIMMRKIPYGIAIAISGLDFIARNNGIYS